MPSYIEHSRRQRIACW